MSSSWKALSEVKAPRSKGCRACVQRRIKCDLARPRCMRCTNGNIPCPGYLPDIRFIYEGPELRKAHHELPFRHECQRLRATGQHGGGAGLFNSVCLPTSLQRTAFRSQVYRRFAEVYSPSIRAGEWRPLNSNLCQVPSWLWLIPTLELSPADSALDSALSALVLGVLGQLDEDVSSLNTSYALYVKAMRQIRHRISRGEKSPSDYTLATTMLFSMYEMQVGSDFPHTSWITHIKGIDAFIIQRARQNFSSDYAVKLLQASILHQLATSSFTFDPPAAQISSLLGQTYDKASIGFRLLIILHSLPQLQRKVSCATQPSELHQLSTLYESLSSEFNNFENRLTQWFGEFEGDIKPDQDPFWSEPSRLYARSPASTSSVMSTFFCFASPAVAQQIAFHWTGLLLLERAKQALEEGIVASNLRSSDQQFIITTDSERAYTLATNIARTLEYFLHPDMGLQGASIIGFPLAVSRSYLRAIGAQEIQWVEEVLLKMIGKRRGYNAFVKRFV